MRRDSRVSTISKLVCRYTHPGTYRVLGPGKILSNRALRNPPSILSLVCQSCFYPHAFNPVQLSTESRAANFCQSTQPFHLPYHTLSVTIETTELALHLLLAGLFVCCSKDRPVTSAPIRVRHHRAASNSDRVRCPDHHSTKRPPLSFGEPCRGIL
jgi:hypothetical protein